MFDAFTDRSRRVIVSAQEEAGVLRHPKIGPGHLVIGLIREGNGIAASALLSLGITVEATRHQVKELYGPGVEVMPAFIPFGTSAERALDQAVRESTLLGHSYVGTEHLLLGLFHDGSGDAARVLLKLGLQPETACRETMKLLRTHGLLPEVQLSSTSSDQDPVMMHDDSGRKGNGMIKKIKGLIRRSPNSQAAQQPVDSLHYLTHDDIERRKDGKPAKAICGYILIGPEKDPAGRPVCAACQEIYDGLEP
jgi:ATP-dependent Clp protease ATP-binding subunit ClpA